MHKCGRRVASPGVQRRRGVSAVWMEEGVLKGPEAGAAVAGASLPQTTPWTGKLTALGLGPPFASGPKPLALILMRTEEWGAPAPPAQVGSAGVSSTPAGPLIVRVCAGQSKQNRLLESVS